MKRGHLFGSKQRPEVRGTATGIMEISGISNEQTRKSPCSIYIGKLSADTTCSKIRKHLQQNDITKVVDVIQLRCRAPDQSSFCVVVEDDVCESAVYNPSLWPLDSRIRPYTQRNQSPSNPGQQKNQKQSLDFQRRSRNWAPRHNKSRNSPPSASLNTRERSNSNALAPPSQTPVTYVPLPVNHDALVPNRIGNPPSLLSNQITSAAQQQLVAPLYPPTSSYGNMLCTNRFSPLADPRILLSAY